MALLTTKSAFSNAISIRSPLLVNAVTLKSAEGQPIIRPLDVEQVVRANEIAVGGIGEGQLPELAGIGFDLDTVMVTLQRQGFGLGEGVSMSSSVMAVRACMVVSTC